MSEEKPVYNLSAQAARPDAAPYFEATADQATQSIDYHTVSPYRFMDDTYSCGEPYRTGRYLVPHTRETRYDERRRLAYFENYLQPVVDAMIDPVYNGKISRTTDDPYALAMIEDATATGEDLSCFVKRATCKARLYGIVFGVVDNFPDTPEVIADALADRKFPYFSLRNPWSVDSIDCDAFDRLNSITFIDGCRCVETPDGKRELICLTKYDRYSISKIERQTSEGKTVDIVVGEPVLHELGVVPVVPFNRFGQGDGVMRFPSLWSLAVLNFTIFNLSSEIREIERGQTFSILAMQADSLKNVKVGVNNLLLVPMDATMMPQFLSPDAAQLQNLVADKKEAIDAIYRAASQSGVVGVQSSKSGIAKEWDFRALGEVLGATSEGAEAFEESMMDIFFRYTQTENDYEVEYPETFEPAVVADAVKLSIDAHSAMLPASLMRLIDRRAAAALTDDAEELQTILAEIEVEAGRDLNTGLIE